MAKLKLKPGGRYLRPDGTDVPIGGLAKCEKVEGQTIYWSIAGDWYAEDGRFCSLSRKPRATDAGYDYKRVLLKPDNWRSLVAEAPPQKDA